MASTAAVAVFNARNLAKCRAISLAITYILIWSVPILALHPLSEADKATARQSFVIKDDGSFGSPEETYQAVRSLQVVGNNNLDSSLTCKWISASSRSSKDTKDLCYILKASKILECELAKDVVEGIVSGLLTAVKEATSLLDYYYSVGALVAIKDNLSVGKFEEVKATLDVSLNLIKALGQSDGTWHYVHNEDDSSFKAAGLALEVVVGVLHFTGLGSKDSEIRDLKVSINNLFDNIESYDDGAQYFDEKNVDKVSGSGGPLAATSIVLRGVSAFASVAGSKSLKVGAEKFAGLATFFLSMGILENPVEAYLQLDALGILEDNSLFVPLVLSLPSSVLSQTTKDKLQVAVTTVLGSSTPPMEVILKSAAPSNEKSSFIWSHQKLQAEGRKFYSFEFLSEKVDVGEYDLNFEISSQDELSRYAAGGPFATTMTVTGRITISDVDIAVIDSDTGSADFTAKLDSTKLASTTLYANHLQKLKLSFETTSPSGAPFRPQQVFLKLRHESKVEHLFLLKASEEQFELTLDLLGLVEKFYYLSGQYKLELVIGDATMENPLAWDIGSLDLDLPEAPEGAKTPPAVSTNIASIYSPKPEIAHIFRVPEKRPAFQVSAVFLTVTILPLIGFLVGLRMLGANLKGFPLSGFSLLSALGFHAGVASILLLYFLFWLKLNLFSTLKLLGFLGLFTAVTGHFALSYLADISSKVKTS